MASAAASGRDRYTSSCEVTVGYQGVQLRGSLTLGQVNRHDACSC
jgi:hypothetical protein